MKKKLFLGTTAALATLAVLGLATPASAHDVLVASNPAADSSIGVLPETFTITMNEPLLDLSGDASGFAIQVVDADGAFYGDGCLAIDEATLEMGATLGDPGQYTFRWQAVSQDGHPVSGEFAFTWTGDGGTAGSAEPPVCGVTGVEPDAPEVTSAPSPEPTVAPVATTQQDPIRWVIGIVAALAIIGALVTVILRLRRRD